MNTQILKLDVVSVRVKEFLFFIEWNGENAHPSLKQDPTRVFYNGQVVSNFWNFCGVEADDIKNSVLYKMLITIYLEDDVIDTCKDIEKRLWKLSDNTGE